MLLQPYLIFLSELEILHVLKELLYMLLLHFGH